MKKEKTPSKNPSEVFALWATRFTGNTYVFLGACIIIVIWAAVGPIFHYSDTWQLVINTSTSVITFLMVFLIQKTQNKDSLAIQIKLNELVASSALASNRIISVEDMTEDELQVLNKYYTSLAQLTKKEMDLHSSHSVDEAKHQHELKEKRRKTKSPGSLEL